MARLPCMLSGFTAGGPEHYVMWSRQPASGRWDLQAPGFGQVPADAAAIGAGCGVALPGAVAARALFPAGVARGDGDDAAAARPASDADAALADGFLAVGDGAAGLADTERMRLGGFTHGSSRRIGFVHARQPLHQLNFLGAVGRGAWTWLSLWRKLMRPLVRS